MKLCSLIEIGYAQKMENKEEIIELKNQLKLCELKINTLVNILAKEGIISRNGFEDELESPCDENDN